MFEKIIISDKFLESKVRENNKSVPNCYKVLIVYLVRDDI